MRTAPHKDADDPATRQGLSPLARTLLLQQYIHNAEGSMKISFSLLLVLVAMSQVACNTTRGLGQDIEAAGDAVSDLAEETEDELED
jgi:predicted small secreted protein